MDITVLFKACVRTVKTRNKALGLGNDGSGSFPLFSKKQGSEFSGKAKEILTTITKMRDFLLMHRKDYINTNYLLYDSSQMTDSERDQIDNDAQTFMHTCREVIKSLLKDGKKNASFQLSEHHTRVGEILESYLKDVCTIYTEQKAIRVKRAFDKQKMYRLEASQKKSKENASGANRPVPNHSNANDSSHPVCRMADGDNNAFTSEDMEFSPEELQMFEQENQRLYEGLNTLADEVREIEGKVVEISRLQEIFTEKVLQQEQDINQIADTVVGTTENIKEANEELREAMKKNAGFRVWILFFLLVLSFTLLFLDWYNM